MGRYAEAAHKAAQAVDRQSEHLPCLNAGNNMLYVFLLEVRGAKLATTEPALAQNDNFLMSLKRALDKLKDHPLRVHNTKSAMEVPGIGATIASIAAEDLFRAYPPDPPSAEEQEQAERVKAAMKAEEAAKRKRKAEVEASGSRAGRSADAPLLPSAASAAANRRAPAAAARAGAPAMASPPAEADDKAAAAAAPGGRGKACTARAPKPPKVYIPQIGTANYAFLIVLLQAQRGPERLEHVTKQELIDRAEASGLSDKPIHAENPAQGQLNSRAFYSGWSNFKKLLNEGLAFAYSNPKKIQLTAKGLALAERLYRDAVPRGKAAQIAGIPTDGPMLFRVEPAQQAVDAAAAGAAITAAAGLPAAALPSVALRPGGAFASAGRILSSGAATAGAAGGSGAVESLAGPDPRAAAAAAAECRYATAGGGVGATSSGSPVDELDLSLTQRLARQRRQATSAAQPLPRRQPDKQPPLFDPPQPQKQQSAWRPGEIVDLSPSSDDDEAQGSESEGILEEVPWMAGASGAASRAGAAAGDFPVAAAGSVQDEAVAQMLDMGYSARRARRALRRSGDLYAALDIIEELSSDGNSSGEEEHGIAQQQQQRAAPAAPPSQPPSLPGSRPGSRPGSQQAVPGLGHICSGSQQGGGRPRLGSSSQQAQQAQQATQPNHMRVDTSAEDIMAAADQLFASMAPVASQQPRPPPQPPSQHPNRLGSARSERSLWLTPSDIRLPPLPPGNAFSDAYEIVLLVDGREQYSRYTGAGTSGQGRGAALDAHLSRLRATGLAVEHRTLPIGDALWIARSRTVAGAEYVLDYVLERKSVGDLLQSIKSSDRYATQKYFLQRCGLRHVYYLVEGDPELLPSPVDQRIVRSAAASTEVVDEFRVLRTAGIQETFRLYQSLTEAISALHRGLIAPGQQQQQQRDQGLKTFDEFKARMREVGQGATTLHDTWGRMLGEVPGMGPDAVAAVLAAYPTPASLWIAYRAAMAGALRAGGDGAAAAAALLVGVRSAESGRALGADKSRKVFQGLFMNRWELQGRG